MLKERSSSSVGTASVVVPPVSMMSTGTATDARGVSHVGWNARWVWGRSLNEGLCKIGLTPSEVKMGYIYIGTSKDSEYFIIPNQERPKHVNKCVCGHKIIENCYLRSLADGHTISMGNCCIKQFINRGRVCEDCGASHRNRKNNKCSECRKRVPAATLNPLTLCNLPADSEILP